MPVKGIQVFRKVNSQKVGIEYRRAGLVDDDDAVGIGVGIELDTQFRGTQKLTPKISAMRDEPPPSRWYEWPAGKGLFKLLPDVLVV